MCTALGGLPGPPATGSSPGRYARQPLDSGRERATVLSLGSVVPSVIQINDWGSRMHRAIASLSILVVVTAHYATSISAESKKPPSRREARSVVAPRSPGAGVAASPQSSPRKNVESMSIYLPADVQRGKIVLLAHPQSLPPNATSQEQRIRSALRKLLAYPAKTDESSSKRLHTAIPPGAEILKVQIGKNRIAVDLTSRVLNSKSVEKFLPFSTMRDKSATLLLAQIVFTATEWSHDSSVSILIEGRKRSRLGNADISKAWRRKDFRSDFLVTDSGGRPIPF